ncbi:MAG TPA: CPBP family intramembrane glutamic endopeptidase [Candidatus Limnocylindrales bacterium]|nr:CPBP family intramembrane glutamic endopeptidase [Candidatus Limnocylindrales bacterium]
MSVAGIDGAAPGVRGSVREHRLVAFGGLVLVLTLVAMAAQLGKDATPFALVFVPFVSAIVVAGVADGVGAVVVLFRRIARWRAEPKWYAVALGVPLLMWTTITAIGVVLGTPVSALFKELGTVPIVLLVVLIPAFIEEFGWRGFAVPSADRSWPLIQVALVVGLLFLIPHIGLYLPGQIYQDLPFWPLPLIILSGSVLYTWVFVGSRGSALVPALMHAASNGLTPISRGVDPILVWQIQGVVITLIAVAVVLLSSRMRRPIGEALVDDSERAVAGTHSSEQPAVG